MELGLTIPLRRHLKMNSLPHGETPDRGACWDLHVITLRGRKSLLAVHCRSRYAFVLFGLSGAEWEALPATFLEGLRRSLDAAGVEPETAGEYLRRAGEIRLTRTHGRREVAFLNRAWEDVTALDHALDPARREQPLLDREVNAKPSRCAGCDGTGPARQRLARSLREGGAYAYHPIPREKNA